MLAVVVTAMVFEAALGSTATAAVVVSDSTQAFDVSSLGSASARGPVPVSRLKRLFPARQDAMVLNNAIFTRPVCVFDIPGFRIMWPETGAPAVFPGSDGDCSTRPAEVSAAAEGAAHARANAKRLGFGATSGDRRGRGRLARRGLKITPNGLRNVRQPWPAGGTKAIDILIDPRETLGYGIPLSEGIMFCSPYVQGYSSVFGRVSVDIGTPAALISSTVAHETFHAVQCNNRRMGLVATRRRGNFITYDMAPSELVEGGASWFAYSSYPEWAASPFFVDWGGGFGAFVYPHPGRVAWNACADYELGDALETSGYGSAPLWLAALDSRPAKRLFAAHRKALRRQVNPASALAAFNSLIGSSATRGALERLYQSACRERRVPGLGNAYGPQAFHADFTGTAVMSQQSSPFTYGDSTSVQIKPMSIGSVIVQGSDIAGFPWDDAGLDFNSRVRVTVTGSVTATVQTARESVAAPSGQPVEVAIPPGRSVRIDMLNVSASSAAGVTVSAEIVG